MHVTLAKCMQYRCIVVFVVCAVYTLLLCSDIMIMKQANYMSCMSQDTTTANKELHIAHMKYCTAI